VLIESDRPICSGGVRRGNQRRKGETVFTEGGRESSGTPVGFWETLEYQEKGEGLLHGRGEGTNTQGFWV